MFSLGNKNKKKGFKQKLALSATPKIVFQAQAPRLVPPSERENLPTNVFVTSVDVEEGKWGKKAKKEAIEEVTLDYGEEDIVEEEDTIDEKANKMWETVETVFDSYPVITQPDQGHVGNLVAWKVSVAFLSCSEKYVDVIEGSGTQSDHILSRSQSPPGACRGCECR